MNKIGNNDNGIVGYLYNGNYNDIHDIHDIHNNSHIDWNNKEQVLEWVGNPQNENDIPSTKFKKELFHMHKSITLRNY